MRKNGKMATRRWRARKDERTSNTTLSCLMSQNADSRAYPYKSPASFGKTKRRVENALPKSPRKRAAVMQKLAKDILQVKLPNIKTKPSTYNPVDQVITQYYTSDSISRVMPGKADVVTIRDANGTKMKLQKRHLFMTVGECYQMFKEEHPECTVGISKFASLRPKNVLLSSDMPHNVCGCKYHNNIILMLESLHKKFPEIVPIYSSEFINQCVCDAENEDCMSDNCENCNESKLFHDNITGRIGEAAMDREINWLQWQQDGDQF